METLVFDYENGRKVTYAEQNGETPNRYEVGDGIGTIYFPGGIKGYMDNTPGEEDPRKIVARLTYVCNPYEDNVGYKSCIVRFGEGREIKSVSLNYPEPAFSKKQKRCSTSFKDWVLQNQDEALSSIKKCIDDAVCRIH